MIRLALIRHGHTAWNRAGRIQGRSDIPLDDDARAELSALRLPPPWDGARLWSSPMMRAAETAQLIAGGSAQTAEALTEMNWGDWEGKRGEDLIAQPGSGYRHIEHWGWQFRPPGGESVADIRARLTPWVQSLTEDSVAVCHIGIMRVLLAQAHGWDFTGEPPFRVKRRRLYPLVLTAEGLRPDGDPIRLPPKDAAP